MSLREHTTGWVRSGHQVRHAVRTQWERRIPRRLADGAISPAGVPSRATGGLRRASTISERSTSLATARAATAVSVDVAADIHWIARLGGAGVVMIADEHQDLPGGDLAAVIRGAGADEVTDALVREQVAIRTRREAWRMLRPEPPSLSVLLPTSRPEQASHAAEQLARQRAEIFQLIVGLHGSAWDRADTSSFTDLGCDVTLVRLPSATTLGSVLTELSDAADGDVVTKWDDDDHYGPHHLEDLQAALSYSGADIVGRGADFVFVEASNVTIRRPGRSEAFDRVLAGGTLMMRRDLLNDVGGWGTRSRHVDQDLIDRVHRRGGWTYRTHPFGYLLTRRAGGHTWDAPASYFESAAIDSRPGLDLEFAGIVP
jgi:hypothetical protein